MRKIAKEQLEFTVSKLTDDVHMHELPNPVPMAPPVGFQEGPDALDLMRQALIREHVRLQRGTGIDETFEEANDFDVGDDIDPASPWEEQFDPVDEEVRGLIRSKEYRTKFEARLRELGIMEVDDGDNGENRPDVDAGRNGVGGDRDRQSDTGVEGVSSSSENPEDRGGVRSRAQNVRRSPGKGEGDR